MSETAVLQMRRFYSNTIGVTMLAQPNHSWDPDEWETFGVLLLRQRHGVALVRVPDKSGGDGGLDAYAPEGTAWQCYAPENEPLTPKQRYNLQRGKITADLKKLVDHQERVRELLGEVVLSAWVLLTPKHESADLVAHCATKTAEMRELGLDFIGPEFRVYVQDHSDFAVESRRLEGARIVPGGLQAASPLPEVDTDGVPFADATGPLITVMDEKLQKIAVSDAARSVLRAEYLKSKIAGDDHLARFDDHLPDVGDELRRAIANAKRRMVMEQAVQPLSTRHLHSVQADLESRITDLVPEIDRDGAEFIAQGSIAQWLQECSMTFDGADGPAGEAGGKP